MSKNFMIAMGIGLAVIAIAVCGVLFMQRGARVGVEGQFLKVRTTPIDENSTIVVLDFRLKNPSDYPFVARNVTAIYEDPAGGRTEGSTFTEVEAKNVFQVMPTIGQRYNQTFIERDKVPGRGQIDRMVMAKFDMSEAKLQARKQFLVKIEEIDGGTFEIAEKPAKQTAAYRRNTERFGSSVTFRGAAFSGTVNVSGSPEVCTHTVCVFPRAI